MSYLRFIYEYVKNPRNVGAVVPSSDALAKKMVENIDFSNARCIVEYGAGTGVFTKKILEKKNNNTIFLSFETNEKFFKILKDQLSIEENNNFVLINDSVEDVEKYLKMYNVSSVDYIISGLPFTSLPKNISDKVLTLTKKLLQDKAEFITFQYTLVKMNFFKQYFDNISYKRVLFNIPPAYVLRCKNLDK
ncbi:MULTISPECIES: class I SAM-dependent methyltransferase [unclassified Gemella]|uniref:class I SAM-dependent methyltransferase n=1 Tax=unclassified Gemella TaxID=2624949 RepID=UPI001C54E748|nr:MULTISPECIES: rRNA adenine N-6-methyltransferase family protein [unclassified Gemella]